MVERLRRSDRVFLEALRLWICIGIENWFINRSTTGPETAATHFVRISFNHHETWAVLYAWMRRCRTARKAGDGQIKGSPEKMYRACFANKPGAKFRKYATSLPHNAPDPLRVLGIIGSMFLIHLKWGSIWHFDRCGPYGYMDPQRSQGVHHFLIKLSY